MDLSKLPNNIPSPQDDGAAKHLSGKHLPDITLTTTAGDNISLAQLNSLTVLFIYPMTGRPDTPLPSGWDDIPGARGCTPQSCAFRDLYSEFQQCKATLYGISAQDSEYQAEAKNRLRLPYELLSDEKLLLKNTLALPTFTAADMALYKRLTLITDSAKIIKVFYPVFPPDKNADDALNWLRKIT